jgi:hypothetical protein
MTHRHTKPDQFELFGPPMRTRPMQTPHWRSLPTGIRRKITSLMVQLLMAHEAGANAEPDRQIANPPQSGESGDV